MSGLTIKPRFHIHIEPTEEMYAAPINGQMVPVRIWRGVTQGGTRVEAYVLALTPDRDLDWDKLRAELPEFVKRSREQYTIDTTKP